MVRKSELVCEERREVKVIVDDILNQPLANLNKLGKKQVKRQIYDMSVKNVVRSLCRKKAFVQRKLSSSKDVLE